MISPARAVLLPLAGAVLTVFAASAAVAQGTGDGAGWTVSETLSPVDYSPQIVAMLPSGTEAAMFGVYCRRGRTEVSVGFGDLPRKAVGAETRIVQRIGDGPPEERRWSEQPPGGADETTTLFLKGDAIAFLRSLPDDGAMTLRVQDRQGTAHEATFRLAGFDKVRARLAVACKWPKPVGP